MSPHTDSFSHSLMRWLLLLVFVPPLAVFGFSLALDLVQEVGYGTLALLLIAAAVCFQLQGAAARIVAAVLVLCVLPNFLAHVFNDSPLFALLALGAVCAGAYLILRHRHGHKPQSVKIQGVERTPVLPGAERHAMAAGPAVGPAHRAGDHAAPEETH